MSIGDRLREIRKGTSLSQAAFAKKFDLSPRAYASYELGERELPSSFILKLHEGLSIDPTWVLTGQGSKTSEINNQMITDTIVSIRTFATLRKLEITPEREAKLALMLLRHFQKGGTEGATFIKNIMEIQASQ